MRDLLSRVGSVVQLLLWINVIVFLLQVLCGALRLYVEPAHARQGMTVMEHLFALSGEGLRRWFLWQPLTYMFLHSGLLHILINLLILWFIGREVEYFLGPKAFTRLYLYCGLLGAALWLAFNFRAPAYVLGASAAVLGTVIAFATLFPNREITFLLFFVLPISMKAKYIALILVAFDLIPVVQQAPGNIAHLAHLGGMFMGYLYVKHLGYGPTPRWLLAVQTIGRAVRPRRRPAPRELSPEEFIRQEVDPILEKIAREGMKSLTRRERKILESAKDLMAKRQR
jgi:membrane associated rhomboid family serine protease